jgi:hypothetical protein
MNKNENHTKEFRKVITLALAGSMGFLCAMPAVAIDQASLDALKATAERVKAFADRLPEDTRKVLSSGAQNMIHLAEIEPKLRQAASSGQSPGERLKSPGA